MVARFLDCHSGLVGNRNGQSQVILGELPGWVLTGNNFSRSALRIEVKHAQGFVAAFHRHTDRLMNAETHDALPGIETLVPAGIGHQNPLLLSKHVFDDGAA